MKCKNILFALLLLCYFIPILGNNIVYDSSLVSERQPPNELIEKIYNDEDYQFDRVVAPPTNIWDKFNEWLSQLLVKMLNNKAGAIVWEIMKYLIVIAAVVIIIMLITNRSPLSLFYGDKNKEKIKFNEYEDKIHIENFDSLIKEAIERKDFRKAVRLYFLKTLKYLSEQNLITWKPDKTNYEYYIELNDAVKKEKFKNLSLLYEYIWYGDFPVTEETYKITADSFNRFFTNGKG